MTSARTTQKSSLAFCFFTIPFFLVIALALDGLIACAETVIGPVPSHEKTPSVPAVMIKIHPSVVTILTRGVQETPTQALWGSGSCGIIDESEYILTNNQLVAEIKSLVVGPSLRRLTPGHVVARDFLLDLVLVKITAADLVPATLNPSPVLANVAIALSGRAVNNSILMDAIYPHIQSMIALGSVLYPDTGFMPVTTTSNIMAGFWLEGDHDILALNVEPRELAAVGGFQNFDIITTVGQHQMYNLEDFWHSFRPCENQPSLQLTIQKKSAQATIWLQNPSLPKVLS